MPQVNRRRGEPESTGPLHCGDVAGPAQIERALASLRRAETYAACQAIELDAARRGQPAAQEGLATLPAASLDSVADAADALAAACRAALGLMAPEVAETVAKLIELGAKTNAIEREADRG